MELLFSYASRDEIPEGMADLFTERDGKFEFTAIKGIKMQSDLDKLQGALENERNAHKQTKSDLNEKVSDLSKQLDEASKVADPAQNPGVPGPGAITPSKDPNVLALQSEMEKAKKALEEMQKEKEVLEADKRKNAILEALRKEATGKIRDEAIADLELYQNNFDLTDSGEIVVKDTGASIADWFSETLKSKPHWEKTNVSGNAKGANPGTPGTGISDKKKRLSELMGKESLDLREQTEASELAGEIKAQESEQNN
jgi:vacuolar-type H+-ATPase subunit I/STV1